MSIDWTADYCLLVLGKLFIIIISKLNWFGSVRVAQFKQYKTGNRTEPNIFLNILIGLIGFFSRFGFFS